MADLSPRGKVRQAALTKRYVASLPEKSRRIQALWQKTKDCGWQIDIVKALSLEIHRLAGSAGSYGFDHLSHLASRLDTEVKNSAGAPSNGLALTKKLQELLDELARVATNEDPA